MIYNGAFNDYKKVCSSCAVYIVFVIFLIISISISSVFIYFQWYSKKKRYNEASNYQTYKWEI